jgi:ribokinase
MGGPAAVRSASRARLVSLGSINADFVVRVEEPLSGSGSTVAQDLLRTSGGKGANVAVVVARLGADVSLLGCVGDDDLADQALAGPRKAGVDTTKVRRRRGPTGYSSVLVPPDGAKAIAFAVNANEAWADEAGAVADDVVRACEHRALVADLEVPAAVVRSALAAAKQRGLITVLDPAPTCRVDDELLRLSDHVTPDQRETEELTGIDVGSIEDAARAAHQLLERGATTVHVKLDSGGCVTTSNDGAVAVHAPADIEVADATGAGDAFAGALGSALLHGAPVLRAAQLAVGAATCAVTRYGSQESYPSGPELEAMAERVRTVAVH